MHLVRYREAQRALMATPPSLPETFAPDVPRPVRIVAAWCRKAAPGSIRSRSMRLLAAYRIPVVPVVLAATPMKLLLGAPMLADGGRSSSRSCRRTSCTNPKSAACG